MPLNFDKTKVVQPPRMNPRLPNAPKDDFSRNFSSSGTTVFSQGSGAMTIGGGLYDGGTEKPVASFTDTRTRANLWGVNNRITNTGDVSLAFAGWRQVHALLLLAAKKTTGIRKSRLPLFCKGTSRTFMLNMN
jgi:hypothetical protein